MKTDATIRPGKLAHILVTNDDGIDSPGLVAAVHAVIGLAEITVIAPTTQQTARGRSLQGNHADFLHPIRLPDLPDTVKAYHLDASPALAVRHGLAALFSERPPDLLLSGINYGENVGGNITVSGTIGAAIQAAAHGIPAIAASRQTGLEYHYEYGVLDWKDAIRVTRSYAERMLRVVLAGGTLPFDVLKVDVPDPCPTGTEERFTVVSRQPYYVKQYRNPHPSSRIDDSFTTIVADRAVLDPADDIYAIAVDRVVSVTPLTVDLTASLDAARRIFSE